MIRAIATLIGLVFMLYFLVTFGLAVVISLVGIVLAFAPIWIPVALILIIFYMMVKRN